MPANQIQYQDALQGYHLHAQARNLSPNTLNQYNNVYRLFGDHIGPTTPIAAITPHQVQTFLATHAQRVSKKTLLHYHVALSALWTWLTKNNLTHQHLLRHIDRPIPEKTEILPYTDQDIRAILSSLDRSRPYRRPYHGETTHTLRHPLRHRAILYLLLDTGIRASELCRLKLHHLDLRNRQLQIHGKGSKTRTVPISPRTAQILWQYIAQNRADAPANGPLFITEANRPFQRRMLHQRITNICHRAGVQNPTLHRFRHTFAINYLRNNGNIYTLQQILGHTTLKMVKHYLTLSQTDLNNDHLRASPITNWGL